MRRRTAPSTWPVQTYDAVAASPKARIAQGAGFRIAYAERDTRKIHTVLSELLQLWPNDTAVQNDEAYARLLLMPDDPASAARNARELRDIEALAAKLVEKEPTSLPHRTASRPCPASPEKAGRSAGGLQGRQRSQDIAEYGLGGAVHAAVLAATGHPDDARAEAAQLPADKMLPEEKKLLAQSGIRAIPGPFVHYIE